MATLNTILKEIKDVPVDRLDEVYEFVHSLTVSHKSADKTKKKDLLSFAGILSDWSQEEYKDFVNHTKEVRKELFNRRFDV